MKRRALGLRALRSTAFCAHPLASRSAVSLVEPSPSTVSRLKLRSAASRSAARRNAGAERRDGPDAGARTPSIACDADCAAQRVGKSLTGPLKVGFGSDRDGTLELEDGALEPEEDGAPRRCSPETPSARPRTWC